MLRILIIFEDNRKKIYYNQVVQGEKKGQGCDSIKFIFIIENRLNRDQNNFERVVVVIIQVKDEDKFDQERDRVNGEKLMEFINDM